MDKSDQVRAQCKAVAHLATVLATVHADYEQLFAAGAMVEILDVVGERTASVMETLGNILNDMDAASDDDEWMKPVFAEAQRLWPTAAQ